MPAAVHRPACTFAALSIRGHQLPDPASLGSSAGAALDAGPPADSQTLGVPSWPSGCSHRPESFLRAGMRELQAALSLCEELREDTGESAAPCERETTPPPSDRKLGALLGAASPLDSASLARY